MPRNFNVPIRRIVKFVDENFTTNRSSAFVTMAAAILIWNYPVMKVKTPRKSLAIPLLYGKPGSRKSTMACVSMAMVGIKSKSQGKLSKYKKFSQHTNRALSAESILTKFPPSIPRRTSLTFILDVF